MFGVRKIKQIKLPFTETYLAILLFKYWYLLEKTADDFYVFSPEANDITIIPTIEVFHHGDKMNEVF